MLLLIEFGMVILLLVAGCWSKRVAIIFVPLVGLSLILFALRFGNPIGLLASGGGWIMLDTMLVIALLVANLAKARG